MNWGRSFVRVFCIAALGITFSQAVVAADDGYLIKKRDFKKSIKKLAIAPVDASAVLGLDDAMAIQIENYVAGLLQKEKYEVIPSSEYRALREMMSEDVGGTTTAEGQPISGKVRAVREHSYREMLYEHDHDGTVMIKIALVRADYKNDMANWDGTRQKVQWQGRGNYETTILASSVEITIFDRTSLAVFSNKGGLEVLMERIDTSFVPIPKENYFKDGKRIQDSLKIAVAPL